MIARFKLNSAPLRLANRQHPSGVATTIACQGVNSQRTVRRGATLTEVLVALLIMSIGLVSLATLFPLATLRAAKAVQFTAATDLRFNAEALLDMYPEMITDPDLDRGVNTLNIPAEDAPSNEPVPQYKYWVIDPLGWSAAALFNPAKDKNNLNYADFFGVVNDSGSELAWSRVQRFHFNRSSTATAAAFLRQPDSFQTMQDTVNPISDTRVASLEKYPAAATGFTRAVASSLNVNSITVGNQSVPLQPTRIVFLSTDGLSSQVRMITKFDTSSRQVTWTEDINGNDKLDNNEDVNGNGALDHFPLPSSFEVGSARIESPERRYTWLMTVRRTTAPIAEIDLVVFFRRQVPASASDNRNDERLYEVLTPISGQADQPGLVVGHSRVKVKYTTATKPAFRRGGFMFDGGNARWYRIADVVSANDKTGEALLTLDPPPLVGSPRDNDNKVVGNRVMFPRAVVDVFPLGTKP